MAFGSMTPCSGRVQFNTGTPLTPNRLQKFSFLLGFVRLRWFPNGAPWHLEGRLRWSDLQDRLSSRDRADTQRIPEGGTPGWTVLDLGWGVPLDHGSSVGVALENVFDVDYRRHGSGVNEPGRNLVVRFEQSF